MRRKVGDGKDTYFWTDWWVGDAPLCEKFCRLFDLSVVQKATVAEMFVLGWGEGGGAWKWRRRLLAWEEELVGECMILPLLVTIQVAISDQLAWTLDPIKGYSV